MNFADIIVAAAVIGIVILALGTLYRNKKNGKSSCGCDCGCCTKGCSRR